MARWDAPGLDQVREKGQGSVCNIIQDQHDHEISMRYAWTGKSQKRAWAMGIKSKGWLLLSMGSSL